MQPSNSLKPNDVLSKAMHVRPLAPGEVRIYRLIAADQLSSMQTDEAGNKLYNKPSRGISRQSFARDIETGERVMIGNVVSSTFIDRPDGSRQTIHKTAMPKFHQGNCRCTEDDFATVQYMERHDGNIDNPFRDKKKAPVFYCVNPKRKALDETNKVMVMAEALVWVGNADHTEIKAINDGLPDGLKINMNNDWEVIKGDMLKLTAKDPISVMKVSHNQLAVAKIAIMECENFGILMWDDKSRKWFYNDKEQETVASIEIGTNRIDGLLEYFGSDDEGKKTYKRMVTKLKKFLNAGAPS
jgi:hypothetical protein